MASSLQFCDLKLVPLALCISFLSCEIVTISMVHVTLQLSPERDVNEVRRNSLAIASYADGRAPQVSPVPPDTPCLLSPQGSKGLASGKRDDEEERLQIHSME